MDALWLPVLWQGEPLTNAMIAMQNAELAGVLVEADDDRYDVVFMDGVKTALARGARTLKDVQVRDRVHLTRHEDATTYRLDLVRPLRTGMEYQALLDKVGMQFALVAHAYDMGLVVTRHEGGRRVISQSNTFYCQGGPTVHHFPKPDVQVGEDCPKCVGQPKGKIYLR